MKIVEVVREEYEAGDILQRLRLSLRIPLQMVPAHHVI
jgi:hypothetical protein